MRYLAACRVALAWYQLGQRLLGARLTGRSGARVMLRAARGMLDVRDHQGRHAVDTALAMLDGEVPGTEREGTGGP